MKVLAVNAGSSSLKYQLFEMPEETVICSGLAERIGIDNGIFSMKINGEKYEEVLDIKDHTVAVNLVLEWFKKYDVISDLSEITGVGHRVVHGGEYFNKSVIATEDVIQKIADLSDFAPLHNPAHILGIRGFEAALPNATPVVVFDTAFHQTMPEEAYMYATPYEWYEDYKVRKYGMHGTSHDYVSKQAANLIGKPYNDAKIIVCHLGNGASLCAVKDGESVDTSMGFTPLAGIPMGTRSGDIDPAIIPYICEKYDMTVNEVIDALNKKSGFLGVSGVSSDGRDIVDALSKGNKRAELTVKLYGKRIADVIGSYYMTLGGCDIIAFTAGVGENAVEIRQFIFERLGALGVKVNSELNLSTRGKLGIISEADSKITIAVIPTNEELVIAQDVYGYIK
jgi:acetate kinase